MSPENGFKFRTGHNGTQLGQWQEGVCSGCLKPYMSGVQSGRCSPAKHGGAYFSAVYGFMKLLGSQTVLEQQSDLS